MKDTMIALYKKGIELVWAKAKKNAFYRGIPFIWCSNNLTTSFDIQCHWYRELTGDNSYSEFEQANFDWLFGVNPWGTSMVYGLPKDGDTPVDPHAAFSHIGHLPVDGGLVDGPVYTTIYSNLIGISLFDPDEYAEYQSSLAVYHDDYGDYSTNEPTMDGTASLIYLLAAKEYETRFGRFTMEQGGITRGDSTKKEIALVFTADEFFEGLPTITKLLAKENTKGSFFFTGRMYRNPSAIPLIQGLQKGNHYLGAHSDQHLLYTDWVKRDSTLVAKDSLLTDFSANIASMKALGINTGKEFFIPPYEWWNRQVADWYHEQGIQLINFTNGTRSNADYTYPAMGNSYLSSDKILEHLKTIEKKGSLKGAILLIHAGTDTRRKDKLYDKLPELIGYLRARGYSFKRVDELLN
jgi:peptidoglycan/xylan/chitin deacetylase (PgdA/CDA1 family)